MINYMATFSQKLEYSRLSLQTAFLKRQIYLEQLLIEPLSHQNNESQTGESTQLI